MSLALCQTHLLYIKKLSGFLINREKSMLYKRTVCNYNKTDLICSVFSLIYIFLLYLCTNRT